MITVKELKDFLSDVPDRAEVRIESEFHKNDETYFHHDCVDIILEDKKYLVLSPECIAVD